MALPRQLKEIDFTSGLNTKGDRRAQPEQLLDVAVNVEFDDIGGLRCRFPFDNVRTALVGGGTLANARNVAMLGDQLLCFTVDSLYSWSATEAGWVRVGTHLAAESAESAQFQRPADQVQCDRAQLGNVVLYTWAEGNQVYAAARDALSDAVLCPPTAINAVNAITNSPRVVALQTRFLLFGLLFATTELVAITIDPANIATGLASAPVLLLSYGGTGSTSYDVAQVPGADHAIFVANNGAASYKVAIVDASLATVVTATKARAGNVVALAVNPTATKIQIARTAASVVRGDLLDATTLADVAIDQDIGSGSGVSEIAMAYRSVQDSGQYRCYVFWTETTTFIPPAVPPPSPLWINWADDGGTLGTATSPTIDVAPASRAFDLGGRVFVWLGFFAGSLENTLFLYRDDGFLVAKGLDGIAGPLPLDTAGSSPAALLPPLPGVQVIGGVATVCATERRIVTLPTLLFAPGGAYADRCPRDLGVQLDSNAARRCARFGDSLYISGGEVLVFDGAQLVECGWHLYPWSLTVAKHVGGSGNIPDGTYGYESTLRWTNAQGEIDRSTNGVPVSFTMAGGPEKVDITYAAIYPTHKTAPMGAFEIWRTAVAPTIDAPFFLATGIDPTITAGDNAYESNNTASPARPTMNDNIIDAALTSRQQLAAELENLAPPAASIIFASDARLFLAGIPGFPNQIWYSKLRTIGSVAAFNDALTIDVPTDGGAVTAIGVLDGALIVWCETATYQFAGGGFDNAGGGSNYALARILATDTGCEVQEAVAFFDGGYLVSSGKGWYVLDRSLNYSYVGAGVYRYDAEPVLAMLVLTMRNQIRILTSNRMLVFDTLVNQWAETSVNDGLDMLMWNGRPAYLTATGVRAELATWDGYAGTDYTLTAIDVETSWIKFGAMQARAIVDFVQLLGELRPGDFVIRKRLAKDYEASSPGAWNYNTDVTWTPTGTVGSALQVRQSPKRKRCESVKARFTITAPDGASPLDGPCARMTSIAIPFAVEPNPYGALGAAQKQ